MKQRRERLFMAYHNHVRACYSTESSLFWKLAVVKFRSFRISGGKIFYFPWHQAV
jgi:hypothetical protein